MIYISCSDEEFEGIIKTILYSDFCYVFGNFVGRCKHKEFDTCEQCIKSNIKHINFAEKCNESEVKK